MIASVSLGHGGSSEFGAEDDDGIVEHTTLFEIDEQGSGTAIDFGGGTADVVFDGSVVVPIAMVELYEADTAFCHTTCQEAIGSEGSIATFGPVEVEGRGRFISQIHQIGNAGLHAKGQFILADPGSDFGVIEALLAESIQLVGGGDDIGLTLEVDTFGVSDVHDGVTDASEFDTLEFAGEEAGVPLAGGDGLFLSEFAGGDHHHEAGEVLGGGAQAVPEP